MQNNPTRIEVSADNPKSRSFTNKHRSTTMSNFSNVTDLEIVEEYAEENNFPFPNEYAVREYFEQHIQADVEAAHGDDDEPALNEAFNNWTDALCKAGAIHPEQYNNYTRED